MLLRTSSPVRREIEVIKCFKQGRRFLMAQREDSLISQTEKPRPEAACVLFIKCIRQFGASGYVCSVSWPVFLRSIVMDIAVVSEKRSSEDYSSGRKETSPSALVPFQGTVRSGEIKMHGAWPGSLASFDHPSPSHWLYFRTGSTSTQRSPGRVHVSNSADFYYDSDHHHIHPPPSPPPHPVISSMGE